MAKKAQLLEPSNQRVTGTKFEESSVRPVQKDSFVNADTMRSLIDNMLTDNETAKQSEYHRRNVGFNLDKEDASVFRKVLSETLRWGAKALFTGASTVAGAGYALSEPWEVFGSPDQLNVTFWQMLLDEINPTDYSALRKAGYTRPSSYIAGLSEKLTYTKWRLSGAIDDVKYKELIDGVNRKREESLAQLESEMAERPNIVDIPALHGLAERWQKRKDGQASWFMSKMFEYADQQIQESIQNVGSANTGSAVADYLLEGSSGLVGSVAGSGFTGIKLAKGLSKLGKIKAVASRPMAAAAVEKAGQFSIAAVQTGGESYRVATDAMNNYLKQRAEEVGGEEYRQGLYQAFDKVYQQVADEGLSEYEELDLLRNAEIDYLNDWLDNSPNGAEIRKTSLDVYNSATTTNGLNLLTNFFVSGLYLRGKFPSRNIMKSKPTKVGNWLGKENVMSGLNEYVEENVNMIAEENAYANANGQAYMRAIDDVLGKKGFEQGMWGYLGGHGEAIMAQRSTYNARIAEYKAQQEAMAKQDKIGAASAKTINDAISVDMTYKGLMDLQKEMHVAEKNNDFEAMEAIADRMLTIQAKQAFETGTTKNLIDNYQKIADNETIPQQARDAASEAVTKITKLEKIHNKSLKYKNHRDVYMNEATQMLVQEAANENTKNKIDIQNEILQQFGEEKQVFLSDEYLQEKSENPLEQKLKDQYNQVLETSNLYNELLADLRQEGLDLKSPTQQKSEIQKAKFHEQLAIAKNELRKDFYSDKKNRNKPFNVYESPKYENIMNNLLDRYNGITELDKKGIRENFKERKLTVEESLREAQEKAARKAYEMQEGIAKATFSEADTDSDTFKAAQQAAKDVQETIDDENSFEWGGSDLSRDPKRVPTDYSAAVLDKFKKAAQAYYDELRFQGKEPTFENAVLLHGSLTSMETAEKSLDALVKGWQLALLPGYETLDTQEIHHKMFTDLKSIAEELNNLVEEMPIVSQSNEEVAANEEEAKKQEEEIGEKANVTTPETDMNGAEIEKPLANNTDPIDDGIEIVNESDMLNTTGVTLAHKDRVVVEIEDDGTVKHKKISDELNKGQYAPHQIKLLFTDHYHKGTLLSVEVAQDFENMHISLYEENGKPIWKMEDGKIVRDSEGYPIQDSMPFGEWAAKNGYEKGSDEYISAIPMVVRDSDGHIVSLIHNVRRVSSRHNVPSTVEQSRANLMNMRKAAFKRGKIKVMVTNKTWGHAFKSTKEGVTMNERNPNMNLAVATKGGLHVDEHALGITSQEEQIVGFEETKDDKNVGGLYEIRKIGRLEDGRPKYVAYRSSNPGTLSDEVQQSVIDVIDMYLTRKEKKNWEKYRNLTQRLFNISDKKADMRPQQFEGLGLTNYLNQFIITSIPSKKGITTEDRIANTIAEISKKKKVGTQPHNILFTIQGKVVIAKVYGAYISKNNYKQESIDNSITSKQVGEAGKDNRSFMDELKNIMPNMRPNASKTYLNSSRPVVILKDGNWKQIGKNYNDYLKNTFISKNPNLTITAKFNGDDKTETVGAIQPTIEIEMVDDSVTEDEYTQAVVDGELGITTKKKIADKKAEGQPLTSEEQELYNENAEEINKAATDDTKSGVEVNGEVLTKEELNAKIQEEYNRLKDVNKYRNRKSRDANPLTEQDVDDIIDSQRTVADLTPTDQRQIIEYIFNNVASFVKMDKGKVVNIDEVRKQIKESFFRHMNKYGTQEKSKMETWEAIEAANPGEHAGLVDLIATYQFELDKIEAVKKNWKVFEDEALNMAKKYFEIGGTKNNLAEPNAEEESVGETFDVEDTKDKEFGKTAEEINPKERVSAELKVFCQGIREYTPSYKDENGNLVEGTAMTGIFGIPTYVGFDTIFDTVSQMLADTPATTKAVKEKLEKSMYSYDWMPQLYKKLFPTTGGNEVIQNQFVRYMTKHALDMEFVMFRKDNMGNYSLRIYSTNSSAIKQNLMTRWTTNAKTSKLMRVGVDKQYVFSESGIDEVLREFDELRGDERTNLAGRDLKKRLRTELNAYVAQINKQNEQKNRPLISVDEILPNINPNAYITIPARHETVAGLLQFMDEKGRDAKVLYENKGKLYNIEFVKGKDEFRISKYKQPKPTTERLINWLNNFGIEISEKTAFEIIHERFVYDKKHLVPYEEQWQGEHDGSGYGLLGTLAGTISNIKDEIQEAKKDVANTNGEVVYNENDVDGRKLLTQTIVKALAAMEAKHTEHRIVQSVYDNKKIIYGYTVSKFITDRTNAIKRGDPIVNEMRNTTYNGHSFWLEMLDYDTSFASKFDIVHLGNTALKEQGKKIYRDNAWQKLSLIDNELVKLGFFMSQRQDNVNITSQEAKDKYGSLEFRTARMFSPTMSDKSTATILKVPVVNITGKTIDGINDLLNFGYSQLVAPDLSRIYTYSRRNKRANVDAYNNGAKLFYMLPKLNDVHISTPNGQIPLKTLLTQAESITKFEEYKDVNGRPVKEIIKAILHDYMKSEQQKKLNQWEEAGFISKDENGNYTSIQFLDKEYMESRADGTIDERVKVAAMDYTFNSMVATANSFMAIAGDPAQYFKSSATTSTEQVKDTFLNVGKRLANMIAPGDKLADSDVKGNNYIQLMMNDVFRISDNIKMITKLNDGREITDTELADVESILENQGVRGIKNSKYSKIFPNSIDYMMIESTNAQEYTTWQEHLYVLEKMGKATNDMFGITPEDIQAVTDIMKEGKSWAKLTDSQKAIVTKVMQPMKPVYTGQIYDAADDIMRTVYIKTSSFPLIPQLTAGMELDKLRVAMEKIEERTGKTVRASFSSGNKVGAVDSPLNISDVQGDYTKLEQKSIDELMQSTLELPRSGFRIQQNIPYKSALTDNDMMTLGTQITKLLFGNGVMDMKGFSYFGKDVDGMTLHKEYNNNFIELVKGVRDDLYAELGISTLDNSVVNGPEFFRRITRILKNEAVTRGFPLQDIDMLKINPKTGHFDIPIWMSPNSSKYEALLTAIISHRVAKFKFPGYSFVAGSENGFRTDENFNVDENGSQIVFTDAWNGRALKANQAFVQSKFRVGGKIIDLIKDGYAKKVTRDDGKKVWMIDTEKIDPELLGMPSFRIPTSKHSSMEYTEIAGFLPPNSADLMIVSKDGTVAMGEDYDVDKRYSYLMWTDMQEGKLIPYHKHTRFQQKGKSPIEVVDNQIREHENKIQELLAILDKSDAKRRARTVFQAIQEKEAMDEDTTAERTQLAAIFREAGDIDIASIKTEINDRENKIAGLKEDKKKIHQNNIIEAHKAVLTNEGVNKLMVQKLSVDDARADAEFLEALTAANDQYFTPVSDMYQQQKVVSGAVGKDGTAAYSLDVVGQSLFEQVMMTPGKQPLVLMDRTTEGIPTPLRVSFGNLHSDGQLGHKMTIDGARAIADVHSERQNLMVDNEKEQIAIRINLNNYTMPVDKVLNMLGFDKGEDGHSISFLFISQPIVKEYIKRMEAKNSNTAEYEANKRENVFNELIQEWGDGEVDTTGIDFDAQMTNAKMVEEISNGGQDTDFQVAVLKKFMKLADYGNQLTALQTSINVDSKGVGTNLFEVQEKINKLLNVYVDKTGDKKITSFIENAGNLIGDYDKAITKEERDILAAKGYVELKEVTNKDNTEKVYHMVKPTTVAGAYTTYSLAAATKVWQPFFPYNSSYVTRAMDEVFELIGNSNLSEAKTVETKKIIFNEMRKYLVTDNSLGYFTLTPQQERKRLFFDSMKGKGNKKSLATFLKEIMESKDSKFNDIKSNRLLKRLEFVINNNGEPSLIKLDNAIGQNFDETYIYNAFTELIDLDLPLGEFGGNKNYTSLNLAQDLALYAYMEGGVQEAIQFVKYIPVSYLKKMNIQGLVNNELEPNNRKNFQLRDTLGFNGNEVSVFGEQFMAHNPELAFRVTDDMMQDSELFEQVEGSTKLSGLMEFKLAVTDEDGKNYSYVSIYNKELPSTESKFQLYKLVKRGKGIAYVRVPVKGKFGLNEYSAGSMYYRSLINQPNLAYPMYENIPFVDEFKPTSTSDNFNVYDNDIQKTAEEVAKLDTPVGNLMKMLKPFVSPDTKVRVGNINSNGEYDGKTNTITINSSLVGDTTGQLETVIAREITHSVVDGLLEKHVETGMNGIDPLTFRPNTPQAVEDSIRRLFVLFKETRTHLNKNGELTSLMKKGVDKGMSDREYNVIYAGLNVKEFVERMLTSPEFQNEMNEVQFRATKQSIADQFWNWLKSTLENLGISNANKDMITANTIKEIFTIIEKGSEVKEDTDQQSRELINKGDALSNEFGSPIDPDAETNQGFDDEGNLFGGEPNGTIDDDFTHWTSKDPLYLANFETVKALRASLTESGILKSKCI